jgi:hypothetical protein
MDLLGALTAPMMVERHNFARPKSPIENGHRCKRTVAVSVDVVVDYAAGTKV